MTLYWQDKLSGTAVCISGNILPKHFGGTEFILKNSDINTDIIIEKKRIYEIEITAQGVSGEGIGKIDGFTVFVKNAVCGDRLRIKILKVNKSYAFAKIESIITPSPHRAKPACSIYKQCGGCNIMHIDYGEQLKFKQRRVYDALTRIGGFENAEVTPTCGMETPCRYRNKTQLPVGRGRSGQIVTGFFMPRTHTICPADDCVVSADVLPKLIAALKRYMAKYKIEPYDETKRRGVIRHLFVRTAKNGDVMAVVVTNSINLEHSDSLVRMFRESCKGIVSIIQNINTEKTNLILGKNNVTLWGADKLTDTIGNLSFEISPLSFYQVNSAQTEVLYKTALDFAALTGRENVFDLYCGTGTISLFMAQRAKSVFGVEIVPEAVADARKNAERNNISNAHFYCGSAEKTVTELYNAGERADVVVFDPPRKGADETTLSIIIKMAPKRIVYVSCNPETLARDAKFLHENGGYELIKACPVDMFPHTTHVETVVLLCRKTPDDVIKVKLSLDELELTSAESKATYEKIKEYVMRNFGLKVSTLYIAQTKRKLGIAMGENYNMPKSLESTQPQCPPDKEEAIVKALEHFKMI